MNRTKCPALSFNLKLYGPLFLVSLCIATTVTEFWGDAWENRVRSLAYRVKKDSIAVYAKEVSDTSGIPFVIYAPQNGIDAGKQYNPTIVANHAVDEYTSLLHQNKQVHSTKFWNCIHWLEENMTNKPAYSLYRFNWQQPFYPKVGVPFTSGMSSGRAIEAFTRAFQLSRDSGYLVKASMLLRGFYIPVTDSGFTIKSESGWWYEEFASPHAPTPQILDGHIYALLGVHEYWKVTNDDSALFIVNQGIRALKNQLPFYDAGNGAVYYDRERSLADQHYHELLVGLMKRIGEITGDPTYFKYYRKWKEPLEQPYILRIIRLGNRSGIFLFSLIMGISFVLLLLIRRFIN